MPTLVGFTANKLILNSSNFRREMAGLERIMDVYTSRTEDAEFFQELIVNGASHRTITGYLSPVPTASERYADMLVENVESTNEIGGITTYSVTYVGLFRNLQPKPIITHQPIDTYAFNPFSINIEFVENIGDLGSQEETNFIKNYSRRKNIPSKINGYLMPKSPIAPFSGEINSRLVQLLQDSPFFSNALQQYLSLETLRQIATRDQKPISVANQGFSFPYNDLPDPVVEYRGLIISGLSYQRYGKFAHAFLSVSDSAYFNYIDRSGGTTTLFQDSINYF